MNNLDRAKTSQQLRIVRCLGLIKNLDQVVDQKQIHLGGTRDIHTVELAVGTQPDITLQDRRRAPQAIGTTKNAIQHVSRASAHDVVQHAPK